MKASRMVGILFAVLFVFYILSPVPVFMHYETRARATGSQMPALVAAFYYPVMWTCERVPTVNMAYQSYIAMWLRVSERDAWMLETPPK